MIPIKIELKTQDMARIPMRDSFWIMSIILKEEKETKTSSFSAVLINAIVFSCVSWVAEFIYATSALSKIIMEKQHTQTNVVSFFWLRLNM